jgi:hypothetical protein
MQAHQCGRDKRVGRVWQIAVDGATQKPPIARGVKPPTGGAFDGNGRRGSTLEGYIGTSRSNALGSATAATTTESIATPPSIATERPILIGTLRTLAALRSLTDGTFTTIVPMPVAIAAAATAAPLASIIEGAIRPIRSIGAIAAFTTRRSLGVDRAFGTLRSIDPIKGAIVAIHGRAIGRGTVRPIKGRRGKGWR